MNVAMRSSAPGLDVLVPAFQAADADRRAKAIAVLLGEDLVEESTEKDSAPERWMSQIELAKYLGVHPSTIRRWQIPCAMLGRLPRYRVSEVEAHMKTKAFKRLLEQQKKERDERAAAS